MSQSEVIPVLIRSVLEEGSYPEHAFSAGTAHLATGPGGHFYIWVGLSTWLGPIEIGDYHVVMFPRELLHFDVSLE